MSLLPSRIENLGPVGVGQRLTCDAVLFFVRTGLMSNSHMFPTNQSVSISIQQNGSERVVSARELHAYLEVKTPLHKWMIRMFEYGFTQDIDYQCLDKFVQTPTGGQRKVLDDYALTIDCAKEIAMLQRTEKGKQARLYFIECEKQLRAKQVKEEHEKQTKTILKLEKQIQRMTIEQSRLNEIVKAKVDNPVIPPAHELKAKILGNIKALADASYASTFVSIMNNFMYDMEHHYCVNIGKATRYVGEGPLDVYIRLGYSAQLEELADFKYSPVKK